MIIDFLSAVFNHFYEIMVNDQPDTSFEAKSKNVVNTAENVPRESALLSNSADSFIENSSSDSDRSNLLNVDFVENEEPFKQPTPHLAESPTIADFINDDTSMHQIALFVHYLQYSF